MVRSLVFLALLCLIAFNLHAQDTTLYLVSKIHSKQEVIYFKEGEKYCDYTPSYATDIVNQLLTSDLLFTVNKQSKEISLYGDKTGIQLQNQVSSLEEICPYISSNQEQDEIYLYSGVRIQGELINYTDIKDLSDNFYRLKCKNNETDKFETIARYDIAMIVRRDGYLVIQQEPEKVFEAVVQAISSPETSTVQTDPIEIDLRKVKKYNRFCEKAQKKYESGKPLAAREEIKAAKELNLPYTRHLEIEKLVDQYVNNLPRYENLMDAAESALNRGDIKQARSDYVEAKELLKQIHQDHRNLENRILEAIQAAKENLISELQALINSGETKAAERKLRELMAISPESGAEIKSFQGQIDARVNSINAIIASIEDALTQKEYTAAIQGLDRLRVLSRSHPEITEFESRFEKTGERYLDEAKEQLRRLEFDQAKLSLEQSALLLPNSALIHELQLDISKQKSQYYRSSRSAGIAYDSGKRREAYDTLTNMRNEFGLIKSFDENLLKIIERETDSEVNSLKQDAARLLEDSLFFEAETLLTEVDNISLESTGGFLDTLSSVRTTIDKFNAKISEANLAYRNQEFQECVLIFREAGKILPLRAEDRRKISTINKEIALQKEEAISTLSESASKNYTTGNLEEAINELQKLLLAYPEDNNAFRVRLTEYQTIQKNYLQLIDAAENAELQSDLASARDYYIAASREYEFADLKEQIANLQRQITKQAFNLYEEANRKYKQGEYDKALEAINAALELDPNDLQFVQLKNQISESYSKLEFYLTQSLSLFDAEELLLSANYIDSALQVDPGNSKALRLQNKIESETERKANEYYELSLEYFQDDNLEKALEEAEKAFALNSENNQEYREHINLLNAEIDRVRDQKSGNYDMFLKLIENGELESAGRLFNGDFDLERAQKDELSRRYQRALNLQTDQLINDLPLIRLQGLDVCLLAIRANIKLYSLGGLDISPYLTRVERDLAAELDQYADLLEFAENSIVQARLHEAKLYFDSASQIQSLDAIAQKQLAELQNRIETKSTQISQTIDRNLAESNTESVEFLLAEFRLINPDDSRLAEYENRLRQLELAEENLQDQRKQEIATYIEQGDWRAIQSLLNTWQDLSPAELRAYEEELEEIAKSDYRELIQRAQNAEVSELEQLLTDKQEFEFLNDFALDEQFEEATQSKQSELNTLLDAWSRSENQAQIGNYLGAVQLSNEALDQLSPSQQQAFFAWNDSLRNQIDELISFSENTLASGSIELNSNYTFLNQELKKFSTSRVDYRKRDLEELQSQLNYEYLTYRAKSAFLGADTSNAETLKSDLSMSEDLFNKAQEVYGYLYSEDQEMYDLLKSELSGDLTQINDPNINWWNELDENWKNALREVFSLSTNPSGDEIDKMLRTEELYIDRFSLNSTEPLKRFTKLIVLDISDNEIEDLNGVSNLIYLKKLTAENNTIRSVSSISQLLDLTEVNLKGNKITDLRDQLPARIEYINLCKNPIHDSISVPSTLNTISISSNVTIENPRSSLVVIRCD